MAQESARHLYLERKQMDWFFLEQTCLRSEVCGKACVSNTWINIMREDSVSVHLRHRMGFHRQVFTTPTNTIIFISIILDIYKNSFMVNYSQRQLFLFYISCVSFKQLYLHGFNASMEPKSISDTTV